VRDVLLFDWSFPRRISHHGPVTVSVIKLCQIARWLTCHGDRSSSVHGSRVLQAERGDDPLLLRASCRSECSCVSRREALYGVGRQMDWIEAARASQTIAEEFGRKQHSALDCGWTWTNCEQTATASTHLKARTCRTGTSEGHVASLVHRRALFITIVDAAGNHRVRLLI